MSELPLILAVDEDSEALERITTELQRYARDYKVICGPSTEAALAQLEALHEDGEAVAIVLAARGSARLKGEELLLERVHELHPHAKRALLIPWGGWADEETADAIRNAMALGYIDYYAIKPFSSPDEIFHRLISEFLQEWRRQNAPGRRSSRSSPTRGRRGLRAAEPARPQRRAARVPHARLDRRGSSSSRRATRRVPRCRSSCSRTARRSSIPSPRTSHSTGRACGPTSTIPAVRRRDRRRRAGGPRRRRVRVVRGPRRAGRRARHDRRARRARARASGTTSASRVA